MKHTPREIDEKKQLITRLHRIQGQLNGIEKMISEDRYCGDVLTQIAAAEKGLQAIGNKLFDTHLKTCVREAIQSGDDDMQVLDEVSALMRSLL